MKKKNCMALCGTLMSLVMVMTPVSQAMAAETIEPEIIETEAAGEDSATADILTDETATAETVETILNDGDVLASEDLIIPDFIDEDEEDAVNSEKADALAENQSAPGTATISGDLDSKTSTHPTITELRRKAKAVTATSKPFDQLPSTNAPYSTGKLSNDYLNQGLAMMNYVRYAAGLPSVELNNNYVSNEQHAAVLFAALDQDPTKTPNIPAGMDGNFYSIANAAIQTSNSIPVWGNQLGTALKDAVGYHMWSLRSVQELMTCESRRWILNPSMKYTGFGAAQGFSTKVYTTMAVGDYGNINKIDYNFIAWPASGNFPTDLVPVGSPWSVSLNPNRYNIDKNNLKVTVKSEELEKEWTITQADNKYDPDKQFCIVNTERFGDPMCIIFNLGSDLVDEDRYDGRFTVTVTGLTDKYGESVKLKYNVDFYNENTVDLVSVRAFVERFYNVVLGRQSDPNGVNHWVTYLAKKEKTGADIAYGFFKSKEFLDHHYSDEMYVEFLYKGLMGRSSDAGRDYWVDLLRSGCTYDKLIKGFAESKEFEAICEDYGIKRGDIKLTDSRDKNIGTTKFVCRLFTKTLGRNFDGNGMSYWCKKINDTPTKDNIAYVAAVGFFRSEEFKNKKYSDEEILKIAYRTFLDREADYNGLQYWLGQLASGKSMDSVLSGFSHSKEFTEIMAQYGL